MANSFDFNKIQRKYFNVTLKNGKTLMVAMPRKATFEKMSEATNIDKDSPNAYDEICGVMVEILNNNKQGYKVNFNEVKKYDLEEIMAFMNAYSDFVQQLATEKN